MIGYGFSRYIKRNPGKSDFETLLDIFLELLMMTGGQVSEALSWMTQMDRRYGFTSPDYGMGQFIEDLKKNGYIQDDDSGEIAYVPAAKTGQIIRRRSLDEIFGKLRKSRPGNHRTPHSGAGDDISSDLRRFDFGDELHHINPTESIRNAQINQGIEHFMITDKDLVVQEREYQTITSTALLIDISHSMVLYGEDRITPAKKVAMALSELIVTRYPKDTLDIIVFGNDAWPVDLKELPYLQVGPYHTNTQAALELAIQTLRRRKTNNKQIFMITDGKPSCIREGLNYYKNSFGLDRKIVNKTLTQAARCRRLGITITTFMIARDPYLQRFVAEFTRINHGRAFYSSLDGLGDFLFEDFIRNRKKRVR